MAKAYWINAFLVVRDTEKLAAYAALAGPAMEAAGGRFLARARRRPRSRTARRSGRR